MNRLAREKSPYLLQHAHNPVNWFAWHEEAFALARSQNKPVFLSIGYATCHWCHVMERESFEDEKIGAFLNEHFVSIKVDREERPDVDKIYMTFVQSTTGSGGWPLNVWLTPALKPFFGGTYFPPEERHGHPSLLQVLEQIARLWQERNLEIVASAEELHARLEQLTVRDARENLPLTPQIIQHAARLFQETYDPMHGGFGGAPKFPQPAIPSLLLRAARRFGDETARQMVRHTCEQMAAGGIHDQLGGGFARYAVDAAWLVPHFEKMLYDNAQLAQLYLDVHLLTSERTQESKTGTTFEAVVRNILDYVLHDLTHPDGGFFSAEDADSEGQEGKFYCWTREELSRLLTVEEFQVAARHFGITAQGNFVDHSHPEPLAGLNVLSVVNPCSADAQSDAPGEFALLAAAKSKMRAARALRVRPLLDDKILVSWNGLMLGAFARAAAVLGEEKYRQAAARNLAFIQKHLWQPPPVQPDGLRPATSPRANAGEPATVTAIGTLFHRWRDGERDAVQLLEGYAFLLDGVIQLYETTLEANALDFAIALATAMVARFYDPTNGGFWQSPAGMTDLILRVKDDYDGAEPSGNSVATLGLLKLAAITGREDFRQAAEATLRLAAHRLQNQPAGMAYMLQALDFWLDEPRRVVLAGDAHSPEFQKMLRAAHSVYQPNKIVLGNRGAVEPFARTLSATGAATAFVCTGTACQAPTTEANVLWQLIG